MNQEPIDYLNNRIPVGITREMVYKAIISHIYYNVLVFGNNIADILSTNEKISRINFGLYDFNGPLTTGEATNYFVQQYIGDI